MAKVSGNSAGMCGLCQTASYPTGTVTPKPGPSPHHEEEEGNEGGEGGEEGTEGKE